MEMRFTHQELKVAKKFWEILSYEDKRKLNEIFGLISDFVIYDNMQIERRCNDIGRFIGKNVSNVNRNDIINIIDQNFDEFTCRAMPSFYKSNLQDITDSKVIDIISVWGATAGVLLMSGGWIFIAYKFGFDPIKTFGFSFLSAISLAALGDVNNLAIKHTVLKVALCEEIISNRQFYSLFIPNRFNIKTLFQYEINFAKDGHFLLKNDEQQEVEVFLPLDMRKLIKSFIIDSSLTERELQFINKVVSMMVRRHESNVDRIYDSRRKVQEKNSESKAIKLIRLEDGLEISKPFDITGYFSKPCEAEKPNFEEIEAILEINKNAEQLRKHNKTVTDFNNKKKELEVIPFLKLNQTSDFKNEGEDAYTKVRDLRPASKKDEVSFKNGNWYNALDDVQKVFASLKEPSPKVEVVSCVILNNKAEEKLMNV